MPFRLFPADEVAARALGEHAWEGWTYYCSPRGAHERSGKTMPWPSVDRIAGYDAFRFTDLIAPRPLLLVVGTEAVTSWMTSEAYIAAREPKEVFWVEGATHVDLYDKDQYVAPIVERLTEFFQRSLV